MRAVAFGVDPARACDIAARNRSEHFAHEPSSASHDSFQRMAQHTTRAAKPHIFSEEALQLLLHPLSRATTPTDSGSPPDKASVRSGPTRRGEVHTAQERHNGAAHRLAIAKWVAQEIIPHEAKIRAWLGRSRVVAHDADELIQEAYCRIAMLVSVDHIEVPSAYFFSITRNLLLRRLKRQQIVQLEAIAEIEALRDDVSASPEDQVAAKLAYEKLLRFMTELPAKSSRVVELRKIRGWSQKEIAADLGLSEKAVEKQIWLAVQAIREMWGRAERRSEELWEPQERSGGERR